MSSNIRSKFAKAGAVTAAAVVGGLAFAPTAFATPTAQPGAKITLTNGTTPSGPQGSNTGFDFLLPSGAVCQASTAAGTGEQVNSYVVPISSAGDNGNPGSITYNASGPNSPATNLSYSATTSYGPSNTDTSAHPPAPSPPAFFWSNFYGPFGTFNPAGGSYLAPGTYDVGIACTTGAGVPDNYWNVQIDFAAAPSDPNGFTWSLHQSPGGALPEAPYAYLLPVSAIGVAGAGYLVLRRRRRTTVGHIEG